MWHLSLQAHYGRQPNTPLSNICTVPKSSNLTYAQILHHYCTIVLVDDYLDENGWVLGEQSDILIEETINQEPVDSSSRYNSDKKVGLSSILN